MNEVTLRRGRMKAHGQKETPRVIMKQERLAREAVVRTSSERVGPGAPGSRGSPAPESSGGDHVV